MKKLTDMGDPKARSVFKKEIINRIINGYWSTFEYLIQNRYLEYLKREEYEVLLTNYFIDIFSKENYEFIIDFIQSPSRTLFINSLNKKEISNFIKNPKPDFFKVVLNTINYFERETESQINDYEESNSNNIDDLIYKINHPKNKIYEFWEVNYNFVQEIKEVIPHDLQKEILKKFKENNPEIINLILQVELWDLSPEIIDSLKKDLKKIIIENMVSIWGNEDFFRFESYFDDYFYDTAKFILEKGKDDTIKILKDQISSIFEVGPSIQLFNIFLFAMNHCPNIFDLSNIKIIRGFMSLTDQSEDSDNYEMYYCSDIREGLYNLGINKEKLFFSNLLQILEKKDIKDLKSLVKLRWLEFFSENQLKTIIYNKQINFIENVTILLLDFINDRESNYIILEDYVVLLYKLSKIEKGLHFNIILNNLKEKLIEFINYFLEIYEDDFNKSIKNYTLELITLLKKKTVKK
ncbi:MAG: hypothetical protein ACXACO_06980 [Promethearchaeota archaeon]